MKRLAVVLALMVAGLSGQTLAVGDNSTPPDYYPLKVGAKWHYRFTAGGGQTGKIMNQIAKLEKIDDQQLARLETVAQGNVVASEHLSNTAKGIYRHRYNGIEVSPPVCILRFPIKQGDSWGGESKVGDQTVKLTSRVGEEEVEVPAGKYKTIKVQVDGEAAGVKIHTTYYFAAGVGVVKQFADIGGTQVTLDLEKYEAGK